MSGPGSPLPAASFPIPPPLANLPWSITSDGKISLLTTPAYGFLLQLWAGLQGGGGVIPVTVQLSIPAAGSIAAFNVVTINGIGQAAAPNLATISDGLGIIGFSTSSSPGGTSVSVQPTGLVKNAAWTWTAGGVVWCGVGGVPTQTAPTGAGNWVRRVGVAVSHTSLMIGIGETVELT